MNQSAIATNDEPLSYRQKAFARELGLAIAKGGRDEDLVQAYEAAGYAPNRGNARRLAADPRIKAIADEACAEALRLAGLHIGYLQAKALELLHASPTKIFRDIVTALHDGGRGFANLTPEQQTALDEATWALSEFKIDKDGVIAIKLPDKKSIIEMLAKQLGVGRDDGTNVNVGVSFEQLVQQSIQQPEQKEPA